MIYMRVALCLAVFLVSAPLAAQTLTNLDLANAPDATAAPDVPSVGDTGKSVLHSLAATRLASPVPDFAAPVVPPIRGYLEAPKRRRLTLTTLYVSYAALQLLDVHSTRRGLALGGREANPVMAPIAGNVVAFAAVKTGISALTIHTVEKLRKRNPAVAIAVMVGLTSLNAAVVTNNYRVHGHK